MIGCVVGINPIRLETVHAKPDLDAVPLGQRPLGIVLEQVFEHGPATEIELVVSAETEVQIGVEHEPVRKVDLDPGKREPLDPIMENHLVMPTDVFILETRGKLEGIAERQGFHVRTAVKDPVGHLHQHILLPALRRVHEKILIKTVGSRGLVAIRHQQILDFERMGQVAVALVVFRNRIFLVVIEMIGLLEEIFVLPPACPCIAQAHRNTQTVGLHVFGKQRIRPDSPVFPHCGHIVDITEENPVLGIAGDIVPRHPHIILVAPAVGISTIDIVDPEIDPQVQAPGHILVMDGPEKIQILPEIVDEIQIGVRCLGLHERGVLLRIEPRGKRIGPKGEPGCPAGIVLDGLVGHPQAAPVVPEIIVLVCGIEFLEAVKGETHRVETGQAALHVQVVVKLVFPFVPCQTGQFGPTDRIPSLLGCQSHRRLIRSWNLDRFRRLGLGGLSSRKAFLGQLGL